ncbi:MAG: aldo/keto reductase [Syntrophomonadaceae bacterium]
MRYKKLCKNGPEVSVISFGAWAIGGRDWGKTDDNQSIAAINEALERGVNFLDTADVYGFGHSEALIAKVLKEHGKNGIFVATKAGSDFYNYKDDKGEVKITPNYTKDYLISAAEKSLKRLNVETLDLLQLHSPSTDLLQRDDPWEALYRLKKDGKINLAGLSVQSFKETEQAFLLDEHNDILDCLQVRYNLLEREAEKELFPKAEKYGIGIIARIPILFGFLTGKFSRETRFEEGDHRRFNLSPEKIEKYFTELESHEPLYMLHPEYTKTQLSLGFCLAHPAVSTAIPGGKTPQQVEENCAAADIDISIYKELL